MNLHVVFSVSLGILTGSSLWVQVMVHEQEQTTQTETAMFSSFASEICEKVTSSQRL